MKDATFSHHFKPLAWPDPKDKHEKGTTKIEFWKTNASHTA
jgi:hypothetical protein